MTSEGQSSQRGSLMLAGAVVIGALTALVLGWYGREHHPTFRPGITLGFATAIDMKVALASVVAVLAVAQVVTALRIYGRFGRGPAPKMVNLTHRGTGIAAVLISLPVAYHCLWSLGFQSYSGRVLVHSILGCLFYGVFVTKMLALQIKGAPGWVIPVLGGVTFAALIGVVSTSAFWWFTSGNPTY